MIAEIILKMATKNKFENMKNYIFILVFISILPDYSGILKGQELRKSQKYTIEKQVDSVFQISIQVAEKLDYDKLSQCVDDRYAAAFISNNIFYSSYDSLVNFARTRAQGVASQTITIKNKKITALSESIALVNACGDTKVYLKDGREFELKFYWTFVYSKINNAWKVIQSHQSSQR